MFNKCRFNELVLLHSFVVISFFQEFGCYHVRSTLLATLQASKLRDKLLRQGIQLYLVSWLTKEDGRLMSPKKDYLLVSGCSFFYRLRGRRSEEVKLKGHLSHKIGRDVLVSSFLQQFIGGKVRLSPKSWTKALSLILKQRQVSLRQAIMYEYNNKNSEKQRSKKQIQHGVKIGSYPVTALSHRPPGALYVWTPTVGKAPVLVPWCKSRKVGVIISLNIS